MSEPHPFDQAIALVAHDEGHYTGATSPAYANMVGPFGGVTAATALNAVMLHPALLGEPLALTVNFCAALVDGPFRVIAKPVRTNRSTQHWTICIYQGSEAAPALSATAVTVLPRQTWARNDMPPPAVQAPDGLSAPTGPAPVPWIGQYAWRFLHGTLPQTWDGREDQSNSLLWVRDAQPRPLDVLSLTAMSDVFFPRVWLARAKRVPAGTVSMTVYYHARRSDLQGLPSSWLLGQARAHAFAHGFNDQTAQLWDTNGHLLASTHQTVYYKE
jgi:acyl-CoA thioesterase